LYYEAVRWVWGGEISFCDDVDAYNTNTTFMKSCGDYIKMLNGGRTKSYGARDEIRGSGMAICQVLKDLPVIVSLYVAVINTYLTNSQQQMQQYLEAEPFICMSSETYFTFTKRRLKEVHNVLLYLARYRPSNFGLSTAILMHMICQTCHSPIVKTKYILDILRDVHFQEIMSDYGMFFLRDLDLDRHCILQILDADPTVCKEAMSRNGKGHKPLMAGSTLLHSRMMLLEPMHPAQLALKRP
jgi:hypothetical protein